MKKTKSSCLSLLPPGSLFQAAFWSSAGCMSHVSQQLSACLSPVPHMKWHSAIPKGSCRGFLPQIPVPRVQLLTLPLSLSKSASAWQEPVFSSVSSRGDKQKMLPGMLEIKLMVAAGSDRVCSCGMLWQIHQEALSHKTPRSLQGNSCPSSVFMLLWIAWLMQEQKKKGR